MVSLLVRCAGFLAICLIPLVIVMVFLFGLVIAILTLGIPSMQV